MTFLADVNVRRLLDQATTLELRKVKDEHPLGLGIPKKKTYQHPSGQLKLPLKGREVENLSKATSVRILDLDPLLSEAAWGHLLASPSLLMPLRPPSDKELGEQEIVLDSETTAQLRRLGLVKVFKYPAEELSNGTLSDARLAAVAVLTLLPGWGGQTTDAWLKAHWTSTTQGLSTALEWLLPLASGASTDNVRQVRVLVVLTSHWVDQISEDVKARLRRVAHIFGFRLDIHNSLPANLGSLETSIRQEQPRHLVILGPIDITSQTLMASFSKVAIPKTNQTLSFDLPAGEDPVPAFREHLANLAGMSAGLVPLLIPEENVLVPPGSGTWEVLNREFTKCMHDSGERQYRQDRSSENWWTKDTAQHGESTFKAYSREGELLVHICDYDKWGNPMPDKYKGEDGREINWNALHGCGSGHVKS